MTLESPAEKTLAQKLEEFTGLAEIPLGCGIICEIGTGVFKTTVLSISTVANDDGFPELGIAPVNFRGDLVVAIQYRSPDEQLLRFKPTLHEGVKKSELLHCQRVHILL